MSEPDKRQEHEESFDDGLGSATTVLTFSNPSGNNIRMTRSLSNPIKKESTETPTLKRNQSMLSSLIKSSPSTPKLLLALKNSTDSPKSPRGSSSAPLSDGTETVITANKKDTPSHKGFNEVYSKVSTDEWLKLYLNKTTFEAGEKMIGIIDFQSQEANSPVVIIKITKELKVEYKLDDYKSTVHFINYEIRCDHSPCWFEIRIPKDAPMSPYQISFDKGSLKIKSQLSITMMSKKSLLNIGGIKNFSSKIPFSINMQPCFKRIQNTEKMISKNSTDQQYKNFQLRAVLSQNVLEIGKKHRLTLQWTNPTQKYDPTIVSFHIYLVPKIEINFQGRDKYSKDAEKKTVDKTVMLEEILLGDIPNSQTGMIKGEQVVGFPIPNEGIYPNENNADDFNIDYCLKIVGTLYDYQIKGPSVIHGIYLTSSIAEENSKDIEYEVKKNASKFIDRTYEPARAIL